MGRPCCLLVLLGQKEVADVGGVCLGELWVAAEQDVHGRFCSFDQFRWPEVAATSYGSVDGVDVKEVCVGRVGCESEGIIECLECELVLVER